MRLIQHTTHQHTVNPHPSTLSTTLSPDPPVGAEGCSGQVPSRRHHRAHRLHPALPLPPRPGEAAAPFSYHLAHSPPLSTVHCPPFTVHRPLSTTLVSPPRRTSPCAACTTVRAASTSTSSLCRRGWRWRTPRAARPAATSTLTTWTPAAALRAARAAATSTR